MISTNFQTAIEKWIKADTWHTNHPSDDERFYDMLSVAESEGASNFDVGEFIDVTSALAQKHHPKMDKDFLSDNVHEKALQAEAIMAYLFYKGRRQI